RDQRVRKAIHLATDRDELINLVGGGDGQLYATLYHFFPGTLTEQDLRDRPGFRKDKAKDLTEAKQLLAAAGYEKGLEIPSYLAPKLGGNPSVEDNSAAHAQQLARVNIRAKIEPIEYSDWTPRILAHQFDITGVNNGARQDPDD